MVRKLLRHSFALSVGLLAAQLLTAITYWIVARSLDPAELGPLMGAIGIGRIITTVADFGMNSATVRTLARQPALTSSFNTTLAAKVMLAAALGFVWVAVAGVGAVIGVCSPILILLGSFIAFEIVASTLEVPLRAKQRMLTVSLLTTTNSTICLLSVVIIVMSGRDPSLALPLSMAIASALTVLCSWKIAEPQFRRFTPIGLRTLGAAWKDSINFGLVGFATQIQRADVAVVGAIAGSAAAGIFSIAARLVGPLSIIPYAYSAALFPRVAGAQGRRQAHREVAGSALLLLICMSALLGTLFIYARPAVQTFLGNSYLQSVDVLRVYLIGLLVASLNQPMANFLQAEGHERYVARIVAPTCLAGLVGIAIGAAVGGAFGAAFGFILLHLVVASFLLVRTTIVLRSPIDTPPGLGGDGRDDDLQRLVQLR